MHNNLELNTKGRDFVVGDIHGAVSRVTRLMDHVKFQTETDRLISVGDLVDRGPNSLEALELLENDWFHAVMGNHEDLMCGFLERKYPWGAWSMNGGGWYNDLDILQKDYVKYLCDKTVTELPWIITVGAGTEHCFHVMHAELNEEVPVTDEMIQKDYFDLCNSHSWDGPTALWGRWLFRDLYRARLTEGFLAKYLRSVHIDKSARWMESDQLSPIYVGHSIMRQPTIVGKMINLDTCGYASYGNDEDCGLTMTEPRTGKFWTATKDGVKEVTPIKVL